MNGLRQGRKMVTVGELIEHLKQFDPSLRVGISDWYGDFIPMGAKDFSEGKDSAFDTGKPVLLIDVPHKGIEPD